MKLKPCPFCGGEAKLIFPGYYKRVRVECSSCLARMGSANKEISLKGKLHFESIEQAVEAWNKRV